MKGLYQKNQVEPGLEPETQVVINTTRFINFMEFLKRPKSVIEQKNKNPFFTYSKYRQYLVAVYLTDQIVILSVYKGAEESRNQHCKGSQSG